MAETVTPQAGDVWIDRNGEPTFVVLVHADRITFAFLGSAYMGEDDVEGFLDGQSLLVRDGKPVPAPQPDAGETITVECAVTR